MADTFSAALKARKIEQNGYDPAWADRFNADVVDIIDAALEGQKTISIGSSTSVSLAALANGTLSDSHYWWLVFTGTPASAVTLTVPASVTTKEYLIDNQTGQAMTVKYAATSGVTVQTGDKLRVLCDGTTVIESPALPRFKTTAAEKAASVTPTNFSYPPGHIYRYGTNTTPGTTDMTAAVQAACDSVPSGGGLVYGVGELILITGTVDIDVADTTIEMQSGGGFTGGSVTMFSVNVDGVKFKGTRFQSTSTSSSTATVAARAWDVNDVTFDGCSFGRVLMSFRSQSAANLRHFTINDCTFDGDYTGVSSVPDVNNAIDARGNCDFHFTNNKITSAGQFWRFAKFSTAIVGADLFQPAFGCKRVIFAGNTFNMSGPAQQQLIDFSYASTEVVIANNVFNIAASASANIIQGKASEESGSGDDTTQDNIKISDNVFRVGDGVEQVLSWEGNWGLAGFSRSTRISITGNIIDSDDNSVNPPIGVKGFNSAIIKDNQINHASVQFARGISVANCQRTIIAGNDLAFGVIEISGNGSTADADSYGNSPESIIVHDNTIDDFNFQGGISFFNCSAVEEISVHDNHVRNQTDTATVQGAIYFDTVTTARLNIHDNVANLANTAKNIIAGTPTVTTYRHAGNSWNQASATWDPGSLADGAGETSAGITAAGAALGDWVQVSAPYDLQDCTVNGYVQAANTIEIRLQNESTGTRDLASGTWRVAYGRG